MSNGMLRILCAFVMILGNTAWSYAEPVMQAQSQQQHVVKISKVVIRGNKHLSTTFIQTVSGLEVGQDLTGVTLDAAKLRLIESGYFGYGIADAEKWVSVVGYDSDGSVALDVNENPVVERIDIKNPEPLTAEALMHRIKLKVGSIVRSRELTIDKESLEAAYNEAGFGAEVSTSIEKGVVTYAIAISRFGAINFSGLHQVRQEQAMALSKVHTGDVYSQTALSMAVRSLVYDGRFMTVGVTPSKKVGNEVNVEFEVTEREAQNGAQLSVVRPRLELTTGHSGAIWLACVSPNGALVATTSLDDKVCLWNARTGDLVKTLTRPYLGVPFSLVISADGESLACASMVAPGSANTTITIWDIRTGEISLTTDCLPIVTCLAFARGNRLLVVASVNFPAVKTPAVADKLGDSPGKNGTGASDAIGEESNSRGSIVVLDAQTGHTVSSMTIGISVPICLAVTHDAKSIAWGGLRRERRGAPAEGCVGVCDLGQSRATRVWKLGKSDVLGVALTPNGGRIAAVMRDGSIALLGSGTPVYLSLEQKQADALPPLVSKKTGWRIQFVSVSV